MLELRWRRTLEHTQTIVGHLDRAGASSPPHRSKCFREVKVESAECRLSWTTIRQGTPRCMEESDDTGREDDEVVVDSAMARTKG